MYCVHSHIVIRSSWYQISNQSRLNAWPNITLGCNEITVWKMTSSAKRANTYDNQSKLSAARLFNSQYRLLNSSNVRNYWFACKWVRASSLSEARCQHTGSIVYHSEVPFWTKSQHANGWLITDGLVVRADVSVTWSVLSWSGVHAFEPWSGRTWGAWYFCPKSYLNQTYFIIP